MIVTVLPDKIRFGADDFVPRFLDYASKLQILPGQIVTIAADADFDYIEVGGTLRIARTGNFSITFQHLFVLPNGYLDCGTEDDPITGQVQFIIKDKPIDLTRDPFQWGNSLLNFGMQDRCGLPKLHGSLLTAEAKAGDTHIALAEAAEGWLVGDAVLLPDMAQRTATEQARRETPVTIAAIDATLKIVTLSKPLDFDHLAVRRPDGSIVEMPYVVNLTRNVVIRSQNPTGTPGHTADVGHDVMRCVCYNEFVHLGRTKNVPLASVVKNPDGSFTPGTNQVGRYTDHMHHIMGGDVQTFGNAYRGHPNGSKWGLSIHNTHDTTAHHLIAMDFKGSGFVIEDGYEVRNVLADTVSIDCVGNEISERENGNNNNFGASGNGVWARGIHNTFQRNQAYGCFTGLDLFNLNVVDGKYPSVPGGEPDTPYDPNAKTMATVEAPLAVGCRNGLVQWGAPRLTLQQPRAFHNNVFALTQPTSGGSRMTVLSPQYINQLVAGENYGVSTSSAYTDRIEIFGGEIRGFYYGTHDGSPFYRVSGTTLQNLHNCALHAVFELWLESVVMVPIQGQPLDYATISKNILWNGQLPLPVVGNSLAFVQSGSCFHIKNWQGTGKDYQLFNLESVGTEPAWWATNDDVAQFNCPIRNLTCQQAYDQMGWVINSDMIAADDIVHLEGVSNLAREGFMGTGTSRPPLALLTFPNRYEIPHEYHPGRPRCHGVLTGTKPGTKDGVLLSWDGGPPIYQEAFQIAVGAQVIEGGTPDYLEFFPPEDAPLASPGNHTLTMWRVDLNGAPIAASRTDWPFSLGTLGDLVTVPNVVGLSQQSATAAITAATLVVGTVTNQTNAAPAGQVLSQSPLADSHVPAHSAVNLVVSSGPATTVTVPNVVGQQQAAAQSALTAVGLTSTVTTKTDAAAKGTVLTQTPAAGMTVQSGSSVALVVSDGPAVETWANAQAQTSSLGKARLLKPDGTSIELTVKP